MNARKGNLPDPVPALNRFSRVPEAGINTRKYIGLDRNERLTPFPDWFMETIKQAVQSKLLTCYPVQDELEEQLSQYLGLDMDHILLSPSSDAAMKSLYQSYLNPGDRVVMLDPSYAMFPVYADMFGAESIQIPYNSTPTVDEEQILDVITAGVKLVMIANPNQPTGTILENSILRKLVEKAESVGAILAVDEAYYPFSKTTAMPMIAEHPNLVVMRTFSKAAGLAGLRIGYVAGDPRVIANLYKVRTVNDMNSMALLCASEILRHPDIIDQYVAEVTAGGIVLAEEVKNLGLEPLPTHANFMLIRVGQRKSPDIVVEELKTRGFLVKSLSPHCVSDCIRVTLGPPALMIEFASNLSKVI